MSCDVSEEQLWCWIDDDAPELAAHLAECPRCRKLAEKIRVGMNAAAIGAKALGAPLPEKVGSYVIKGLLGEGGQGIVYEAEQQSPQRSVALKVLKGGRFVDRHDIRHFQREIQSLAALNHSGIATVYEAGRTEEGQYFFSMELVAGQPLDGYARDRDLPLEERLELFGKVCDAVEYAHEQGVIHRDLKPTNVLVGADGDPKILDFGLARITEADVTLTTGATETGRIMGTLRYMSPEQACGSPDQIGMHSDVYSLGVILYELLTDRAPYDLAQFMPEAVRTICEQPPEKPSSISRTLGGDLQTIVLKALEKEPLRRYQSVGGLGEDLRRYMSGEPILAKPPSGLYVLRKKLSKHRLGFSAGAVVVILGLSALLGGISWKQHELAKARQRVLLLQHHLDTGDARVAHSLAAEELAKYPRLPDARLALAHAKFRMFRELGDERLVGVAIAVLRQGIDRSPSQTAFHALLAEIYRHTNNPEAEKLQEQVDRHSPDTAEEWYLLSLATMDVHKAVQRAERAVERDPGHRLAWERLAYAYLQTKDFDGALRAARELMHLTGDHLKWTITTGHILLRGGRYREAIDQYARAADLDPGNFWPYRERGIAHLCLREYPQAIEYYSKAVDLSPPASAWEGYQRATPLWIMGKTREAAADYRETSRLRGQPSYADARLFLVLHDQAEVLDRQDQGVDATRVRQEARDALEAASRGASAGSWLASIMACLARKLAPDKLMDLADPGNPAEVCEAHYYAGEAYRLRREFQKSRECFADCVRTGLVLDPVEIPPDPMNEYHLALWRLEQLSAEGKAGLPNDGD